MLSASDTQIVVRVPLNAPVAFVNLTVTTVAGSTSSLFTVDAPAAPAISDVSPDAERRGATLTITGTGFVGVTSVSFGAVRASFTVTDSEHISVVVPAGLASNSMHTILVEAARGNATDPGLFTVLPSPPTITQLSASTGAPGTEIDVTGTDFVGVLRVGFELASNPGTRVPAALIAISGTLLRVTLPSTAGGPAMMWVETPDGEAFAPFTLQPGAPTTYTLTVVKQGTGSGTVTSTSPAGLIDCGSTCNASVTANATVTLNAGASSGSTFAGWTGCTSASSTTCTVTMDGAKSVTATFNTAGNPLLTIALGGTGRGTVTSSPTGINCFVFGDQGGEPVCTQAFATNTNITLTATPNASSLFGGWGHSSCSSASCTTPMPPTDSTIDVTFHTNESGATKTLALTLTPNAGPFGVLSSPHNYAAATGFGVRTWVYATGATVTLSARSTQNQPMQVQWGGDCASAGVATTCTLTTSANRTVTATSIPLP